VGSWASSGHDHIGHRRRRTESPLRAQHGPPGQQSDCRSERIGHPPQALPTAADRADRPIPSRPRGVQAAEHSPGSVDVSAKTRERQRQKGVAEIPSKALLTCLTARRAHAGSVASPRR
jgi:hypothetical protein